MKCGIARFFSASGALLMLCAPAFGAEAGIRFLPAAGESLCRMTVEKSIRQGVVNQRFSEEWTRVFSVSASAGGMDYQIKFTPVFQPTSVFTFTLGMSKTDPTPIDPRDHPGEERERVALAASFPESFVYGRQVAMGGDVPETPAFRSIYTEEMLSSGFVEESFEDRLVLTGEEVFEGAPVYLFTGATDYSVSFNDGRRHVEKTTATMRFDKSGLLLRHATFAHRREMLEPAADDPLIHENMVAWRCQVRE